MHKQNAKRASAAPKVAKKTTAARKVAVKKTTKRKMALKAQPKESNIAGVVLNKETNKYTMAAPIAPFSDLETIRSAVKKYNKSFAMASHESPFQGLGKIIKQYGIIPFTVLGLSALASKEVYMIDPAVLITFNTTTVIFSYYVTGFEGAKNAYNGWLDTINGKYQEGLKSSVEILEAGIKHCQSALDKPGIIQDSNAAFQEAHDALTVARVNAAKQKHTDAILGKLNAIANTEAVEAKQQADAIRDEALAYLKANAFTDKVKADVLDEALSMVGKKTGTGAQEFKSLQNVLKTALDTAQKGKK